MNLKFFEYAEELIDKTKAEAYKEFAERLKEELISYIKYVIKL